jgi:hypothetical protein
VQSYPKGNYIYYGKSVEETPGLFTGYYRIEYVGKNPEEAKFVSEEFKRFNGLPSEHANIAEINAISYAEHLVNGSLA